MMLEFYIWRVECRNTRIFFLSYSYMRKIAGTFFFYFTLYVEQNMVDRENLGIK